MSQFKSTSARASRHREVITSDTPATILMEKEEPESLYIPPRSGNGLFRRESQPPNPLGTHYHERFLASRHKKKSAR